MTDKLHLEETYAVPEWLRQKADYAAFSLGASTLRMHMEDGDLSALLRELASMWERER